MYVVLFEDDLVGQLFPVTIGKAAFTIGCGAMRLIDLADDLGGRMACVARPHLRALLDSDFPDCGCLREQPNGPALFVNGRMAPSAAAALDLRRLFEAAAPALVAGRSGVAAAVVPAGTTMPRGTGPDGLTKWLLSLKLPAVALDLPLFEYPHDIVRRHMENLGPNLSRRIAAGDYREVADGVFLAPGAKLGDYVVTDTKKGPIVVESNATIGPHCYLSGPAHVGRDARVIEHSALKDGVALGHTTKIGGEVEASTIEPYTNKQHHGFLGHSYLGSWVNLGAGTCNSDLKNTYGQVKMEYNGRKVATDMQFIGSIVGDYAKTAINTGIFTGKTIGACSMVYGFVTTNVPSFVNYARLFGQVTEAPVEVMVATQARMFARRHVVQRPVDVQLLHDMYELTRHERQLADEPLAF